MISGAHLESRPRYVVMRVNDKRFLVGLSTPNKSNDYIVLCETKTEMNAKNIMEALARMEETSG